MNEWTNEWMNEQINEWMNEWMNEDNVLFNDTLNTLCLVTWHQTYVKGPPG